MANSMEDVLQKYKETTSVRLLVEELVAPLAQRLDFATSKLNQFDAALRINVRKLEEMDVFLRKLSHSQHYFENLWGQVQELDAYKEMAETRREEDLKEIKYKIDEVENDARNDKENLRVSVNKVDVLANQYRGLVQDVIAYKRDVGNQVANIEKVSIEAKEHCSDIIEVIRGEISRIGPELKRNTLQHNEMQAGIDVVNHWVKGRVKILRSKIELEKKLEVKRAKDVEKLEKVIEKLGAEFNEISKTVQKQDNDMEMMKKYVDEKIDLRMSEVVLARKESESSDSEKSSVISSRSVTKGIKRKSASKSSVSSSDSVAKKMKRKSDSESSVISSESVTKEIKQESVRKEVELIPEPIVKLPIKEDAETQVDPNVTKEAEIQTEKEKEEINPCAKVVTPHVIPEPPKEYPQKIQQIKVENIRYEPQSHKITKVIQRAESNTNQEWPVQSCVVVKDDSNMKSEVEDLKVEFENKLEAVERSASQKITEQGLTQIISSSQVPSKDRQYTQDNGKLVTIKSQGSFRSYIQRMCKTKPRQVGPYSPNLLFGG
eukprot:TRINITY_DN352_c0_g1_i1.p1 TRINITY_DN352_c0_g1~~TRINITY_DN352_c0_g1_i1.p1  ORF type:complete len:547 (+),score=71.51 TRINITY_DN352_c0_g1_i1:3164-4804(+)